MVESAQGKVGQIDVEVNVQQKLEVVLLVQLPGCLARRARGRDEAGKRDDATVRKELGDLGDTADVFRTV